MELGYLVCVPSGAPSAGARRNVREAPGLFTNAAPSHAKWTPFWKRKTPLLQGSSKRGGGGGGGGVSKVPALFLTASKVKKGALSYNSTLNSREIDSRGRNIAHSTDLETAVTAV